MNTRSFEGLRTQADDILPPKFATPSSGFVEFLHQERLHERPWFFVTVYIRGWTKKPGDLRRFGTLGKNLAAKNFVQRLGLPLVNAVLGQSRRFGARTTTYPPVSRFIYLSSKEIIGRIGTKT